VTVTFDASTATDPDGTIVGYSWDFGDFLTGSGKIYARFTIGDKVGSSALLGHEGQAIDSLYTKQKVRSAVVLGETQSVEQSGQAINKQKVYIQDYTAPSGEGPEPPSEVLAISVQASRLLIKSWREIYRIIR